MLVLTSSLSPDLAACWRTLLKVMFQGTYKTSTPNDVVVYEGISVVVELPYELSEVELPDCDWIIAKGETLKSPSLPLTWPPPCTPNRVVVVVIVSL